MHRSVDWQPQEDEALIELYCKRKVQKWTEICQLMRCEYGVKHCTPKQCRERFKNHLNPQINKQEWSREEDTKLIELQDQLGNRWAAIARQLHGRTDNSVKNRFYAIMRKALRNLNTVGRELRECRFRDINISFIFKLSKLIDSQHKQNEGLCTQFIETAQKLQKDILSFSDNNMADVNLLRMRVESVVAGVQAINIGFKKKTLKSKAVSTRQQRMKKRLQQEEKEKNDQIAQVKQEESAPVEEMEEVKKEEEPSDAKMEIQEPLPVKQEHKQTEQDYLQVPKIEDHPPLMMADWEEQDPLAAWDDVWINNSLHLI